MTFSRLLQWLISGSDEQTLSKRWLQDKMPQHAEWTTSQQQPGMALIVANTKATAHQRFWMQVAKQRPRAVKSSIRLWKVS